MGQAGGFGAQTPLGTSWGPFALHEPHSRCLRGVKLVTSAHCSSSCSTDPQSGPSPLGCPWRRQRRDVTFPPFCLHTWPVLNKRFPLTAAKAKLFHHLARKPGWGKARLRAHVSHQQLGKGTPSPQHPARTHQQGPQEGINAAQRWNPDSFKQHPGCGVRFTGPRAPRSSCQVWYFGAALAAWHGHRHCPNEDPLDTWHQQVVQAAPNSPGMNDLLEGDHHVP